jgi:hypothetical protein
MAKAEKKEKVAVAKKEKPEKAPKKAAAKKDAKPKKEKKKKDPNAPKKALSAFMFFCADKRAAIREAHPDWKIGDIGKELGAQWQKADDKAKAKYQKQVRRRTMCCCLLLLDVCSVLLVAWVAVRLAACSFTLAPSGCHQRTPLQLP